MSSKRRKRLGIAADRVPKAESLLIALLAESAINKFCEVSRANPLGLLSWEERAGPSRFPLTPLPASVETKPVKSEIKAEKARGERFMGDIAREMI